MVQKTALSGLIMKKKEGLSTTSPPPGGKRMNKIYPRNRCGKSILDEDRSFSYNEKRYRLIPLLFVTPEYGN